MEKHTPEQAINVLKRYSGREDFIPTAPFWEAIRDGILPQWYLDRFRLFRDDYSDDLPGIDLDKNDPDYRYLRLKATYDHPTGNKLKCRKNVIRSIYGHFQGAINQEVIVDEGVIEVIESFGSRDWECDKGDKGEHWTTPEEIDLINDTLDVVISHLEEAYDLGD